MRVVLDTNVVISALNFPGNERLVPEPALRGRFGVCLSQFILGGGRGAGAQVWVGGGTHGPGLEYPGERRHGHRPPKPSGGDTGRPLRQPGVGAAASADYLVTGDRRHLLPTGERAEMRILNAPRFLSSLGRH